MDLFDCDCRDKSLPYGFDTRWGMPMWCTHPSNPAAIHQPHTIREHPQWMHAACQTLCWLNRKYSVHSFSIACLSGNLFEPLVKQGMAEVQEQMENGKGSMADWQQSSSYVWEKKKWDIAQCSGALCNLTCVKGSGACFSKLPKLFRHTSGDIILFVSSKRRRLEARNFAVILFLFPLQHLQRLALQNKQVVILRMAFRAWKVIATFEKKA